MKKIFVALFVIPCIFFSLTHSYGQSESVESKLLKLKEKLKSSGVVKAEDLKGADKALKNMLGKGASEQDLQGVVEGLSKKGVKGRDLRNSLNSINDLVNNGESPNDAGNLVSQAAASAHAQGLKGRELAAKVHQAIKERKAQREQLKKREREREREREKKAKAEKEAKEKKKNKGSGTNVDGLELGKGKGQGQGQGKGNK